MIRIIIGIIIGVALFASLSQADEPKAPTIAETVTAVTEWVSDIPHKPAQIQVWASSEWEEIKLYQAQGWADAKAQNQANWEKLKGLFNTTKTTK
jgi:hypothetical protein